MRYLRRYRQVKRSFQAPSDFFFGVVSALGWLGKMEVEDPFPGDECMARRPDVGSLVPRLWYTMKQQKKALFGSTPRPGAMAAS